MLDEVGSGVAPSAAPLVASDHAIDPGRSAGLLIAAFYALALVVEPPLLRMSERFRVRRWLGAWLLVLGAVLLGSALAGSYWLFLATLALYGPASGAVTAVSEGALVESAPEARERTMARISLAGGLGDLAVPALLAALAALGRGWRDALVIAAGAAALLASLTASTRALDRRVASEDDEEGDPPRLRDVLRERRVLLWSLASSLTGLMDEVMAAFAAVHLYAHVTRDPFELAVATGCWIGGGLAGVAVLERALARVAPARALAFAGAAAIPAFGAFMAARDLPSACAWLALLGALVSTYYPLVQARAYAALPGHPGVVNAVAALLSPLDLAAPLALGVLAEHGGSHAALAALALVPLAMLGVGLRSVQPDRGRGTDRR